MEDSRLLKQFVETAVEFDSRQLWRRFRNDHVMVVHLPECPDPLVAAVMGDGGDEFGLMVLRGPDAIESFLVLCEWDDLADDEILDAIDMLSFNMEPYGELPGVFRKRYRDMGLRPSRRAVVPLVTSKPRFAAPKIPDTDEVALLSRVTRALIHADRKGLLVPTRVDDPQGVCAVHVPRTADLSNVTVGRDQIDLPESTRVPVRPLLDEADFGSLQLIDQTWLIGTAPLPEMANESFTPEVCMIMDRESRSVIALRLFPEGHIDLAADIVGDALLDQGSQGCGVAREIVFADSRLYDALGSVLERGGLGVRYQQSIPELDAELREMAGYLPEILGEEIWGPADDELPDAEDLEAWVQIERYQNVRFIRAVQTTETLTSSRALKRYFNDDQGEHLMETYADQQSTLAYTYWAVLDYRPTRKSKTHAEKILEESLPPAQEAVLRARMEAVPSIYRIESIDAAGKTLEMRDVLLGRMMTVYDESLSRGAQVGTAICARVYPVGPVHRLIPMGPPLTFCLVSGALDFLRDHDMEFTPEGLVRDARKFGWLWAWMDRLGRQGMPELRNSDGDKFIEHTASFHVADQEATTKALCAREDIDYLPDEETFLWFRLDDPGDPDGRKTLLGRIEFIGDELILEVNSARRFATASRWLTALAGVTEGTVEVSDLGAWEESRPLDDRLGEDEAHEASAEMQMAMQASVHEYYLEEWVDKPLAAFQGRTPREVAQTPGGRREIAAFIRGMPDPAGPAGVRAPREELLAELGVHDPPAPRQEPESSVMPGSGAPGRGAEPDLRLFRADKPGRNDPCPCGSGKKYKKCCGG